MITSVEELEHALREWSFNDNIPDDKIIEVPLYVIKKYQQKCFSLQYVDTLTAWKNKLETDIQRTKNVDEL